MARLFGTDKVLPAGLTTAGHQKIQLIGQCLGDLLGNTTFKALVSVISFYVVIFLTMYLEGEKYWPRDWTATPSLVEEDCEKDVAAAVAAAVANATTTRELSDDPCDPTWQGGFHLFIIDSLYYGTVIFSTVGYGDIFPKTSATRALTVLYAFVGILVVFPQALYLVSTYITNPIGEFLIRMFPKPKVEVTRLKGVDGSNMEITHPHSAFSFYLRNLAPWIFLWLVLQLIFAFIFVLAQPPGSDPTGNVMYPHDMTYGLALYHSMITSTTVGFGDVKLHTAAAKIVAVIHSIIRRSLQYALELSAELSQQREGLEAVEVMIRKSDQAYSRTSPRATRRPSRQAKSKTEKSFLKTEKYSASKDLNKMMAEDDEKANASLATAAANSAQAAARVKQPPVKGDIKYLIRRRLWSRCWYSWVCSIGRRRCL